MFTYGRHYLELIRFRAAADLKLEGSQSYLGILWLVLDPLLYLVIFYLLFEVVMQRGGPGFVSFMLSGLVFWRWFDTCVKRAASSIKGNVGIINQVYVPKLMFPVIEIVATTCRFGFVLALFLIFIVLYRQTVTHYWLALPVILLVQMLLISAVGIICALVVPFFPDLRKLLDNVLMFFFFMSGILFDISKLSPEIQQYLWLNPMATMLHQYRAIFLGDHWPDWLALGIVALVSVVVLAIALYVGSKLDMIYPRIVR
jgi:lipopolysaccharide transport system permease protein